VLSSRRLEREAGRNVEVMWLTGRLVPDHKTIAYFRKDNGACNATRQLRKINLQGEPNTPLDQLSYYPKHLMTDKLSFPALCSVNLPPTLAG
jgi:hypothetical protein